MLTYNFKGIFAARGIKRPATVLRKAGLTYNIANRIANNAVDKISLPTMEKVCRVLNCTPNDLYTFTPATEADRSEQLALSKLIKTEIQNIPVATLIQNLPIDKLYELAETLNKKKDG